MGTKDGSVNIEGDININSDELSEMEEDSKELNLKVKELEKEAKEELLEEKKEKVIPVIKKRLKEIELAKRTLCKLEDKYNKLLESDIDDLFYE